jgi:predicted dehydrogenase/threonine dehydrogenase-like Zn-dependent dehydrogenase
VQTLRTVRQKLDAYSSLGYSSAGTVVEVASDVKGFSAGDLVACGGGGYAVHAEIVAAPQNLCVRLNSQADLKLAAYNTLGAIALQGLRQSELRIGETCLVIGLGLIGQLTGLMARAGGIRVIGIDLDSRMVEIADKHCAEFAFLRGEPALEEKINEITKGIGADAVIITAGTSSLDPVNFAGRVARKKGRVVIVGNVPTGFAREPYYRKELELKMSCSYGPGRYDLLYEEKGVDYPVGYVRWTEKRNMEAFQELVHSHKKDFDYLTTHIYEIEDAPKAYELVLNREEPFLGILIKYDIAKTGPEHKVEIRERKPLRKINLAFIGAGNYALNFLLPNFPRTKDLSYKAVMDSAGNASRKVAEKYGFEFCTSDEKDIFDNLDINTIYVVTRHNSHAEYVIKSLEKGKNVAVEKPLCLTKEELTKIKETYESKESQQSSPFLMVGFNRRFSLLTETLREYLGTGPMAMIYRVNAGRIPPDSWIHDSEIGGGRIIGEVCHFVDYLTFMNGSFPESVFAVAMADVSNLEDTLNISIKFKNGSIGAISYLANGSKTFFKEYIEIYKDGITGTIRDFKELRIYEPSKRLKKKLWSRDKGQRNMIRTFLDSIKSGKPSPISFEELYIVTLTTFKVIESIRKNSPIAI